jgi:hypothetical protein
MKAKLFLALAIFILPPQHLHAQNTDLSFTPASGKFRGLASAGTSAANGVEALDLNPAGLAGTRRVALSIAGSTASYQYSLFRQNVGNWAFEVDWQKSQSAFDHIGAAFAISNRLGFGIGYFRKINPFTDNDWRAITGSSLFHQTTSGGVYALRLAAGLKFTEHIMAGIRLSKHSGTITSPIRGDNHGRKRINGPGSKAISMV